MLFLVLLLLFLLLFVLQLLLLFFSPVTILLIEGIEPLGRNKHLEIVDALAVHLVEKFIQHLRVLCANSLFLSIGIHQVANVVTHPVPNDIPDTSCVSLKAVLTFLRGLHPYLVDSIDLQLVILKLLPFLVYLEKLLTEL